MELWNGPNSLSRGRGWAGGRFVPPPQVAYELSRNGSVLVYQDGAWYIP
jgi:hypothetical protein